MFSTSDGGHTWSQVQKLVPADGSANDEFGTEVAIAGDVLVVSARLDNDAYDFSGISCVCITT